MSQSFTPNEMALRFERSRTRLWMAIAAVSFLVALIALSLLAYIIFSGPPDDCDVHVNGFVVLTRAKFDQPESVSRGGTIELEGPAFIRPNIIFSNSSCYGQVYINWYVDGVLKYPGWSSFPLDSTHYPGNRSYLLRAEIVPKITPTMEINFQFSGDIPP